jgi:zinc transporter ZupT
MSATRPSLPSTRLSGNNGDATARRAIWALFFISLAGIVGGVVVAYFGQPVGGIIAVVSAAIGGIVAIVLRQTSGP